MMFGRHKPEPPTAEQVALEHVIAEFRRMLLAIEHMDPCVNDQCNTLRHELVAMARRLPEAHASESES